jgi:hypothetical protein
MNRVLNSLELAVCVYGLGFDLADIPLDLGRNVVAGCTELLLYTSQRLTKENVTCLTRVMHAVSQCTQLVRPPVADTQSVVTKNVRGTFPWIALLQLHTRRGKANASHQLFHQFVHRSLVFNVPRTISNAST